MRRETDGACRRHGGTPVFDESGGRRLRLACSAPNRTFLQRTAGRFSDLGSYGTQSNGDKLRPESRHSCSVRSSDRNQAAPDSQGNRFGAGGSTELVKNRADVELDGVLGDTETHRNIFVDQPLR